MDKKLTATIVKARQHAKNNPSLLSSTLLMALVEVLDPTPPKVEVEYDQDRNEIQFWSTPTGQDPRLDLVFTRDAFYAAMEEHFGQNQQHHVEKAVKLGWDALTSLVASTEGRVQA